MPPRTRAKKAAGSPDPTTRKVKLTNAVQKAADEALLVRTWGSPKKSQRRLVATHTARHPHCLRPTTCTARNIAPSD